MKQHKGISEWKLTAQPAKPDFATIVAMAVARQAASPTAQVIASSEAGQVSPVSLIELFAARRRRGAVSGASFNTGVASLLTPPKGT
ncbi:hypothetical protein HJG53_09360 [Sphingomonas sp. ID1715]|uniref:hypothetical protein n=1 Tax=Sphingomonas sp. ID1715 TaxID=1656898 RepID=UPI0014887F3A|nr:hypothetical protein [Sphingomonas sp. ID1715]NNM77108.1 hypothetical protein [Sphingomonas sp. ID1715]